MDRVEPYHFDIPHQEWRPHQFDVLQKLLAMEDKEIYIVQASTGCHAKGQGLLTHRGFICKVEDISIGDLLMGPDSKPRKVLGLIRGNGPLYKITPVKGEPFVISENHVLTLQRTRTRDYKHDKKARSDCLDYEIIDVPLIEWLQ